MYNYNASLIKVVDGDSIWLNIDLGFSIWTKQLIRLNGLDTPELNTSEGQDAKVFTQNWFESNPVFTLTSYKREKYGRYLGVINGEYGTLNNALLEAGLAVVYNG